MSTESSFMNITLQSKEEVFIFCQQKISTGICINILNLEKNEAFSGIFSNADMKLHAARLRISDDLFFKHIQTALLSSSPSSEFVYCFEKDNENYTLRLKNVDSEGIVIIFGVVSMLKSDFNATLMEILLSVTQELKNLKTTISDLSLELEKKKDETSTALQHLAKIADTKENLEKELFSKFVLVLNEKKDKINSLMKTIKNGNDSNHAKKSNKKPNSYPVISDSSEEMDEEPNLHDPKPSTSKDSSFVFMDEGKETITVPKTRKRQRVPAATKSNKTLKKNDKIQGNETLQDENSCDSLLQFM